MGSYLLVSELSLRVFEFFFSLDGGRLRWGVIRLSCSWARCTPTLALPPFGGRESEECDETTFFSSSNRRGGGCGRRGSGAATDESSSDRVPSCYLPSSNTARIEAFRQGLRELGYVEGKNIVIEWRSAEGKPDRLPELAAELVRLKVDVIVTGGPTVTHVAKEATATIPIVMSQDSDPVEIGFVTSLARPGGNITGLSPLPGS